MSDSSSWWAKKLGGGSAPAPSRPTNVPNTWNVPIQREPTPAHMAPPDDLPVEHYDAPAPAPPGQLHALDAVVRFKGSKAAQNERMECPNCTSPSRKVYLFSRAQGQNENGSRVTLAKMNANGQMCAPASVCFECGYNGLFEAFGGSLSDMSS